MDLRVPTIVRTALTCNFDIPLALTIRPVLNKLYGPAIDENERVSKSRKITSWVSALSSMYPTIQWLLPGGLIADSYLDQPNSSTCQNAEHRVALSLLMRPRPAEKLRIFLAVPVAFALRTITLLEIR